MTIEKNVEENTLTLTIEGRIDTTTAPTLMQEIDTIPPETGKLVLDLQGVGYLSSAGLRAILTAQKRMSKQGQMVVKNIQEPVMEILEMTNFVDILTIE